MSDEEIKYYSWLRKFFENLKAEEYFGTLELKIHNGFITHIDKQIQSVDVPRFKK